MVVMVTPETKKHENSLSNVSNVLILVVISGAIARSPVGRCPLRSLPMTCAESGASLGHFDCRLPLDQN